MGDLSDLFFHDHVKMKCKKASQKLSTIAIVTDITSTEKQKTLKIFDVL